MTDKIRTFDEAQQIASQRHDVDNHSVVRTPDELVTAWYLEHAKASITYLTSLFGRRADAEEVTQEAFLRLHALLLTGVEVEKPRAWIFTVARRMLVNRTKERRRHALKGLGIARALDRLVEESATAVEDAMAARQRSVSLARAMLSLSPLEKQCLVARCQGLRLREVAIMTGLDLRRVSEIVLRAIDKLQERIDA